MGATRATRQHLLASRFALAVIALGLLLLFGLLFMFVLGGTSGWASFAVACFAILFIAGIGMDKIR